MINWLTKQKKVMIIHQTHPSIPKPILKVTAINKPPVNLTKGSSTYYLWCSYDYKLYWSVLNWSRFYSQIVSSLFMSVEIFYSIS